MAKERTPRIHDVIGFINRLFPPALAEEWDNVGLQVGDPAAPAEHLLIALDADERCLCRAREEGVQLVVTHHPLIFKPLSSVTAGDDTGRLVTAAIRDGIGIYCAHTNLDRARDGLNDWLADRLGVIDTRPLQSGGGGLTKLVVYVPCGYEGQVAEALFAAGAGHVGAYDRSSFAAVGTGTFRPGEGSDPFIGSSGETERVRELRLETVVPAERLGRAVDRMLRAHPYEEAAYDLIPLANRRGDVGLGRIGILPTPLALEAFMEKIKSALGTDHLRVVGAGERSIRKVALCGGSGASLLGEAVRQGADVLVTGDVKYHEAQSAQSRGLALVDAGHYATERLMVPEIARLLREAAVQKSWNLKVSEDAGDADPFRVV